MTRIAGFKLAGVQDFLPDSPNYGLSTQQQMQNTADMEAYGARAEAAVQDAVNKARELMAAQEAQIANAEAQQDARNTQQMWQGANVLGQTFGDMFSLKTPGNEGGNPVTDGLQFGRAPSTDVMSQIDFNRMWG